MRKLFTRKRIKAGLISFFVIGVIFVASILLINSHINTIGNRYIVTKIENIKSSYTVLVPGAYVYSNGVLSDVLEDRVLSALRLYKLKKVKRFLLSGDHGKVTYDEVNNMRRFLLKRGVKDVDIFTDHAGFNTYSSIVRAKKVFKVKSLIIVTQKYHLPRALYIARSIGLDAYGYPADRREYPAMKYYKLREVLAKVKAYINVLFNTKPHFLGNPIPITGDSALSRG